MLNNSKEIIKQILVGSFFGRKCFSLRDKYTLFHGSIYTPHVIGTLANDQLAFRLVTSICKPNATFVDVGAHIGSIIAMVSFNLPNVKVSAIEAIPEKIEILKRKFPLVELHSCAVGETTGQTTFYVNSTNPGYSTLGIPEKNNPDSINAINVNIKRLDDIINATDVDVIKIDVEGAELGVLRGAVKLIEQCRPPLCLKVGQ